jgi:bifunctional protein TilS/HprT
MSRPRIFPEKSLSGKRRVREDGHGRTIYDRHVLPTQESLPPLKWLLQPDAERFAHPAEVELARLLTFYNVRWAYEPTTFAVRWGSDGRPNEFVTPDFFLPDHNLYLELTTMRQRLVTRKNRKFRLLREQYPNVNVRMLYLRDFKRLREAYAPGDSRGDVRIGSMLYTEQDVEARVAELAAELIARWDTSGHDWSTRPLIIGAGPGSARFLASLERQIQRQGLPIDVDEVELSSISGQERSARAKLLRPPASRVEGRLVVIAQEVLSTGLSTAFLTTWLRRHGAAAVEVCALLDREAARIVDVPMACKGFTAPDVALVGYGLTRWREYRDLPFIAEIETG